MNASDIDDTSAYRHSSAPESASRDPLASARHRASTSSSHGAPTRRIDAPNTGDASPYSAYRRTSASSASDASTRRMNVPDTGDASPYSRSSYGDERDNVYGYGSNNAYGYGNGRDNAYGYGEGNASGNETAYGYGNERDGGNANAYGYGNERSTAYSNAYGYGNAAAPAQGARQGAGPAAGYAQAAATGSPRESYGFSWPEHAKRHGVRNTLLVILGIILALLIVAGVAAFAYMRQLDAVLEEGTPPIDTQVLSLTTHQEPFYVLVAGVDTREQGNLGPGTYSDALSLMRVDLLEKQITMVSIPRDTRWTTPDGTVQKINAAYYFGGVDMAADAVSEVSGVPISHVMVFDVSDMEEIVDAVGGVEINVETDMCKEDINDPTHIINLQPGLQTLSGIEAQVYARDRFAYDTDQDANRQSNIRTLMEATMRKALSLPKAQLPGTLMDLAPYLHTDMRSVDLLQIAWQYFTSPASDLTFYNGTGPYSGGIDEWYDDAWYCYENPQGWATLMAVVDSGGDPSAIDVESTAITHEQRHEAETSELEDDEVDELSY